MQVTHHLSCCLDLGKISSLNAYIVSCWLDKAEHWVLLQLTNTGSDWKENRTGSTVCEQGLCRRELTLSPEHYILPSTTLQREIIALEKTRCLFLCLTQRCWAESFKTAVPVSLKQNSKKEKLPRKTSL